MLVEFEIISVKVNLLSYSLTKRLDWLNCCETLAWYGTDADEKPILGQVE